MVASDGTNAVAVDLNWAAVSGAQGYVVTRDGVEVAVVDTPSWSDPDAAPGGLPLAPEVLASDDIDWFWVDVQWSRPEVAAGATHEYEVRTQGATELSPDVASDSGFRSGPPVTHFELQIPGRSAWERITGTQFLDRDSPLRGYEIQNITASHGSFYGTIEIISPQPPALPPEPVTYEVRAINTVGSGPVGRDTGFRGIGPGGYTFAFSRHNHKDGTWLGLPEVAPPLASEIGTQRWVPPELGRTYSIRVTYRVVGAEIAATGTVSGYAAECDPEHPCEAPLRCTRGICATDGMVPFFRGLIYRGLKSDEPGYASSDRLGAAELTYDFDMLPTEVTQQEWVDVFEDNPSFFVSCGVSCPVENVTWHSAVAYANALSEEHGIPPCYRFPDDCTGEAASGTLVCESPVVMMGNSGDYWSCEGYRLPTEYEWEVAASGFREFAPTRGLPETERFDCVEIDETLDSVSVYCANAGLGAARCAEYGLPEDCTGTQPVANRLASHFGLHDVLGNVAEWTWGSRGSYGRVDPLSPIQNPLYPPDASDLVVRGGDFSTDPFLLSTAVRFTRAASYRGRDVGFRLVRTRP
jgi:formylglycine-generating enzyme required for sulfatase activity